MPFDRFSSVEHKKHPLRLSFDPIEAGKIRQSEEKNAFGKSQFLPKLNPFDNSSNQSLSGQSRPRQQKTNKLNM